MRKTVILIAGLLILAAVPPVAGLLDDPFLITLFTRVLVFALAAVSLDLIVGYAAALRARPHVQWTMCAAGYRRRPAAR